MRSVATKVLIGITGLLLFAYVLLHLAGNLLIFFGQDTFNRYSHTLVSNPLIVPIEIGLALVFVLHIYEAVTNWARNRAARPVGYQKKQWAGSTSRKSISSTTMIWTGLLTLVFVLIHLKQFRFGTFYAIGDPAIRDLYRTEIEVFSNPLWVGVYVVAVILVAFHLRHGISSACQSLGLDHPPLGRRLVVTGTILAILIGAGFAIIPLWVYLTR